MAKIIKVLRPVRYGVGDASVGGEVLLEDGTIGRWWVGGEVDPYFDEKHGVIKVYVKRNPTKSLPKTANEIHIFKSVSIKLYTYPEVLAYSFKVGNVDYGNKLGCPGGVSEDDKRILLKQARKTVNAVLKKHKNKASIDTSSIWGFR